MCCEVVYYVFFFFKQKTAYEMRISDWSSDVCSSDLFAGQVEADDALVAALAEADGLERPAARYVDRCQYVAVVEQALVALERPPAAHHIIQPRHVVNADIPRQSQLSQRTVPATATQAGKVDGGGVGQSIGRAACGVRE